MLAHCLFALLVAFAWADELKSGALIQTLPPDGSWATFQATLKVNDQEFSPTWTIRSVGQTMQNGKQCRWVELEQTSTAQTDNPILIGNVTWRLLIPEDEFGEGKHPLGKAIKTWVRIEKQEPEAVESIDAKDALFGLVVKGPASNLKREDAKKKISWQQGDLECAVVAGQNELKLGIAKFSISHRVFRHDKVPFGIAGVHQELKVTIAGSMEKASIRVTLQDHGKDAKAKLPDLQP